MKRALIVSNVLGVVSDFLQNDIHILKEREYDITCAANTKIKLKNTDNFIKTNQINVVHIDFPVRELNIGKIILAYKQIRLLLKNNDFDLIHCHMPITSAITRFCARKYRKYGIKVLYTSHGFPFYKGNEGVKSRFFYLIERYLSRYTDCIITICNEDFENAKKMCCKNVNYIPGVGINLDAYRQISREKCINRKDYCLDYTDKVILSIGELNTNKNHEIIIKALSLINDKSYAYVICGREVTEVGKRKELEKLSQRLGVRTIFLGYVNNIPEICEIADIGAITSFKEGLGLSGIEMLASGMPVIGSNRQGIKDYIKDGKTGYLIEPSNVESVSTGIIRTYELSKKEITAQTCIEEATKFSKLESFKELEKIYNNIL